MITAFKVGSSSRLWAVPVVAGYLLSVWYGFGVGFPWWGKALYCVAWLWCAVKAADAYYRPL